MAKHFRRPTQASGVATHRFQIGKKYHHTRHGEVILTEAYPKFGLFWGKLASGGGAVVAAQHLGDEVSA